VIKSVILNFYHSHPTYLNTIKNDDIFFKNCFLNLMIITNISRLKKNVFSIHERTNAPLMLKFHIYTRIYTLLILKHNYVNIYSFNQFHVPIRMF